MAREVDAYGARAKTRSPVGVLALTVLTLGVYGVVWYHRVNVELRDYGVAYNDRRLAATKPWHAVLALVPGFLIVVPPLVSLIGFVGRLRWAQRYGRSELTSGWLIGFLVVVIVFIPAIPGYVQSSLNELWKRYPEAKARSAAAELHAASLPEPSAAELATAPPPRPSEALI